MHQTPLKAQIVTTMNPCELPPCPPCPPPTPPPCPQVCPPPQGPSMPVCRPKPIMRGLHWAQTKKTLTQAIVLSCIAGALTYTFLGRVRRNAYIDFYRKGEFEDWADEMARKGLFQSVPAESLKDF